MVKDNIILEGAKIGYRNFSGEPGRFNPPGRRNFCVFFDDINFARRLADDGWNIRWTTPRDIDDDPVPYMQVNVSFDRNPPKIVIIANGRKTVIGEEEVGDLDRLEITNVDLIIKPYNWEINGKNGVKGYLKSMYVTIFLDELERKYLDD